MVKPVAGEKAKAAELEAALRRHLSSRDKASITSRPQGRPLIIPIRGTRQFPGRPCFLDLEANHRALRAVIEVFPDRVPSVYLVAMAVRMLDKYFSGDIIQHDGQGGYMANGYIEASVAIAATIKILVQRLRRLFRRSSRSRFV